MSTKKPPLKLLMPVAAAILVVPAYLPTILWMVDRWFAKESYYGHGFLIPAVSLYLVWQRRDALKNVKAFNDFLGLWIIVAALLVNIICASLKIYFISGFSLVFVIYGFILFFFGKKMVRNLIFPIFFLFAMIPLPLVIIGNLTVKLKLLATQLSVFVLNSIGFRCIQDGSFIRMPSSVLEVAAPCSGLRSIIALLTLGLLFAYALKTSYFKKTILFLLSIPIAIATNVMRITIVAMVNDLYGEKIALGFFHDFMGYMVFVVAFAGLWGVSRVLEGDRGVGSRVQGGY